MKKALAAGNDADLVHRGRRAGRRRYRDQCQPSNIPVIAQTDVATVQRTDDGSGAVIQLDVAASVPDGSAATYAFTSADGTITSDGSRATWTVAGAGPFYSGCRGVVAQWLHDRLAFHLPYGTDGLAIEARVGRRPRGAHAPTVAAGVGAALFGAE